MTDCKHGMDERWCDACQHPIALTRPRMSYETLREVVTAAEFREAVEVTVPGAGIPAVSPGDRGGTSESAEAYRAQVTEAMLTKWRDGWDLDDTRAAFALKGFVAEAKIAELLGRTLHALHTHRAEVRRSLGLEGA